jgi:hypothetical protein
VSITTAFDDGVEEWAVVVSDEDAVDDAIKP